jgi:hypothetical protein
MDLKSVEIDIEANIDDGSLVREAPRFHDNNWDLVYLRNTRNSLLQLTDKYLIPDYPITPENLEIIKLYRQELRDYINKNKEGILNGVIPEIPPIPF